MWLHGPPYSDESIEQEDPELESLPEECLLEMKARDRGRAMVTMVNSSGPVIVRCEDYSTLQRLIQVTAYVLKFINLIRKPRGADSPKPDQSNPILRAEDLNTALNYWIRISQATLPSKEQFSLWTQQFGLFKDNNGIWRCGGRLENSEVSPDAKHPVFLD